MVFAELPPEVYEEMQRKSPEVMKIHVNKVESERLGLLDFSGDRRQAVEATVISVTRTGSGLKAGDAIVIRYIARNPDEEMARPSPIPQLKEGKEYPAWLSKAKAGHYEPAARGYSFSPLK